MVKNAIAYVHVLEECSLNVLRRRLRHKHITVKMISAKTCQQKLQGESILCYLIGTMLALICRCSIEDILLLYGVQYSNMSETSSPTSYCIQATIPVLAN